MDRRTFVKSSGLMSASLLVPVSKTIVDNRELEFHIFSKHLQFLNYEDMAGAAADLGFDGVDLTVRKRGHVLPENVEDDLPRAVEAIKNAGLKHRMMASDVNNAKDDLHKRVLKVAVEQGIDMYRMGYLSFDHNVSVPERLESLNIEMHDLASLNNSLGLTGMYQNHSGTRIGAALWDLHHLLGGIDASTIGVQYDIRHGVVEGGLSWSNSLRLIAPKINCIVLKDFIWAKNRFGKWSVKNVPLGEGMVDFPAYFKLIKELGIFVPVTVHYEYDLGGVEHGRKEKPHMPTAEIFKAMRKDLAFAKKTWEEA